MDIAPPGGFHPGIDITYLNKTLFERFLQFRDFFFQLRNFALQEFVLPHFLGQKIHRQSDAFFDAPGGQGVGVGRLVPAVLETLDANVAFLDEAGQAKIGLAEADAEEACHFPLGDLVVRGFQDFEDPHPNAFFGCVHNLNLLA